MRTALLALALSAGTPAAGAAAQTPPPPPPAGIGHGGMRGMGAFGALMRADADGDGVVTRDEALAASDAAFDRLDANHDGIVSPDELRATMRPHGRPDAAPPPPAGGMAAGLSRQQWRERALRRFDRLDANHDGKVDRAEIAAFQAASRERRHERQASGDMAPPPPPASDPTPR